MSVAPPLPAEVLADLQAGHLEQTCPSCGRHEAAGFSCSWDGRRMGPEDWYLGRDAATEHPRRIPSTPPATVPAEYRKAADSGKGGWPTVWGPSPFEKASQPARKAGGRPLAAPRRVSAHDGEQLVLTA